MSDIKRGSLVTVGSAKSSDHSSEVNKEVIRLNLVLSEPNKEWCPVFNYEVLIRQAQEKKEGRIDSAWSKSLNGSVVPFSEDDDKESVKRLAKQFEEKYGGNDKKKRCQTYTELGAGYDENDSFIDNTEACEEGLLDEIEKKHNGYYINCERFGRVCNSDVSDADELRLKNKKLLKRSADSEDDGSVEEKPKKPKVVPEVRDTSEGNDNPPALPQNIPVKDKEKKFEIKKPKTVKLLLEEKRMSDVSNQKTSSINLPTDSKKSTDDHKSVNDIIESVINAANFDNYLSSDSNLSSASCPQSGSLVSSESEISNPCGKTTQQPETPPLLPEGLSNEMQSLVKDLVEAASVHKENDKKLFSSTVNTLLLRLEKLCRSEVPLSVKNLVYTHLAYFLPFSKATLVTRGKKLLIEEVDKEIESVINKFKTMIDNMMPQLIDAYHQMKTQYSQEVQSIENESAQSPSKTFTWNNNLRNCLCRMVRLKMRQFTIKHGRKETLDEYIKNFIMERLLPIWPDGWMTVSIISHQCSDIVYREAGILTTPSTPKKVSASLESNGAKPKLNNKNSPDSGHSSDYVSCTNLMGSEKDSVFSSLYLSKWNSDRVTDSACSMKLDTTKVPLKKKKIRTGHAEFRPVSDKQDTPHVIDFSKDQSVHDSLASYSPKTENVTSKDDNNKPVVIQKVPTSKAGPMSLKQRILSSKDNHKVKQQKKHNDSSSWSNGISSKCDDERPGEKPNSGNLSGNIQGEEVAAVDNCPVSPSELERRLHEETTAATDILSQLITDQNSLSQNIVGCGADDKVQMQLNEVMQDLVVLNQMSADTIDTLETNKEDIQKLSRVTNFGEDFYSHIRKGAISGGCEQMLYDDIPNKDTQTSQFASPQKSVITHNAHHQMSTTLQHLNSPGASSSQQLT